MVVRRLTALFGMVIFKCFFDWVCWVLEGGGKGMERGDEERGFLVTFNVATFYDERGCFVF